MKRFFSLCGVIGVITLIARSSCAHTIGLSRGDYTRHGAELRVVAVFSQTELGAIVAALGAEPRAAALGEAAARAVGEWVLAGYEVSSGGKPCQLPSSDVRRVDQDGVQVELAYVCEREGAMHVELLFLARLSPQHRHLAHLAGPAGVSDRVMTRDACALEIADIGLSHTAPRAVPRGNGVTVVRSYFRMGLEHILTGYDHLLFVLGLLLALGPWSSLLAAISAFTVAHSLTLALAASGVFTPNAHVIEPLIALSIAYVGVENAWLGHAAGRWRVAFVFGLIHGFGFASALTQVAISPAEVPLSLLGFNAGVEAGQLAIIAVAWPLLRLARARGWLPVRATQIFSVAIAAVGAVWFVARLRAG